jgi:NAD(P)-dependent dehydrogenase (short-subunit alcohol dehydrogenase family)
MDLSQQVVLVTGANRGLGKALAESFVERGAKVYAAARQIQSVQSHKVIPIQLDVTEEQSIKEATQIADDVTIVINNAGIMSKTTIIDGDLKLIEREFITNVAGPLKVTKAFSNIIEGNGGGAVINILSALSWLTLPGTAGYSMTKAAAWSMTNAMRIELADKNIHVAGVHVAFIDTDLAASVTMPKMNPKDVANAVIEGLKNKQYEIIVDETTKQIQHGLAGGVEALYPQLKVSK